MQCIEIKIRGRRYRFSKHVLELAVIRAERDADRAHKDLLKVVAAYERYRSVKEMRKWRN